MTQPVLLPERYDPELELLGVGGFAKVFRSFDRVLGVPVAVKVPDRYREEERLASVVAHELAAGARLHHPGIIQVLDAGVDPEGRHYLVMELAGAGSLDDLVASGPPPWAELSRIVDETLAALGYAHAHSLVHRDIKGGNILLSRGDDGRLHPRLADFGLAKIARRGNYESTRLAAGTLLYMPPESFEDDVAAIHPGADLYAFGVLLYRLVSGRSPWPEEGLGLVLAKSQRSHRPLEIREGYDAPPTLAGVIERLLARKPAFRYSVAADVRADIATASDAASSASESWVSMASAVPARRLPLHAPAPTPARRYPATLATSPVREPMLVDRDDARATLWLAARRATERAQGVVLTGAAGSGRSRMIRWLAAGLEQLGLGRMLHVRLEGEDSPTAALGRAVRQLLGFGRLRGRDLRERIRDHLRSRAGADIADLELMCAWLDPASVSPTASMTVRRFEHRLALVERLLRSESRRGLVVVWIDDVEGRGAQLAANLLRDARLDPLSLLVLVEPPGRTGVPAELADFEHLPIEPLADADVSELLLDLLADGSRADELMASAAGSPAFATEAARLAAATGRAALPLPPTVDVPTFREVDVDADTVAIADVVPADAPARARLDGFIGADERSAARWRLVAALAIFPAPSSRALLYAFERVRDPESSTAPFGAAIEAAVLAGVVVAPDDGTVSLTSAALARAARAVLAERDDRDALLHAGADTLLQSDRQDRAARAGALLLEAGDAEAALPLLADAGEAALAWDVDDARQCYETAMRAATELGLDPADPRAARIAVGAARAEWLVGSAERSAALLDPIEPNDLPTELRAAWLEVRAQADLHTGQLDEAMRLAAAATGCFSMVGDVAGQARASMVVASALARGGQLEDAVAAFDEARDLARSASARGDELDATIRLGRLHRLTGNREAAREELLSALELARAQHAVGSEGVAQRELGNLAVIEGIHDEAESRLRDAVACLERAGYRADVATTRVSLGELARARGQLAAARKEYSVALGVQRSLQLDWESLITLLNLAMTELEMDRMSSALRRLDAVDKQLPSDRPHRLRVWVELVRTAARAGIGDWDGAEAALDAVFEAAPLPPDGDALMLLERTGDLAIAAGQSTLGLDALGQADEVARALGDDDASRRIVLKLADLG